MTQYQQDALPVPRNRVFVLLEGMFVVQWEENRVQDLLSGRYYQYSQEKFGAFITDWELNQLQSKGIIQKYDDELVYLSSMPKTMTTSVRTFYINTRFPKSELRHVEHMLSMAELTHKLSARAQEHYVIIRGQNGASFNSFMEAELARELLAKKLPEAAEQFAVAFLEVNTKI